MQEWAYRKSDSIGELIDLMQHRHALTIKYGGVIRQPIAGGVIEVVELRL